MKMTVVADKTLFDRWIEVGHAVISLRGIVQNDMHISTRQFAVWKKQAMQISRALRVLIDDTVAHVEKENDTL